MKHAVALIGFVLAIVNVEADDKSKHVVARLIGEREVPVVLSPASGRFSATIHDYSDSVEYELTFQNLQAPVTQAHIHLAQRNVNGGIMVWLCGTTSNPGPMGTQQCPQSGTISGIITAADVIAVSVQGVAAGDFDAFVESLKAGLAYANVHTTQSPGGEIRGQVRLVERGGDTDDDVQASDNH